MRSNQIERECSVSSFMYDLVILDAYRILLELA